MLTAIPLTIIPLIVFNLIAFATGNPWDGALFHLPLVSGASWAVTLADLVILVALVCLFFETLRSARPARSSTITNHAISTIVLIVYIIEFIVVPLAANSLFFVLTMIALFDVVAGFTISIRTASRDISLGQGVDGAM